MQSATSGEEPAEGRAWVTGSDRRSDRRRTYNRRREDKEISPPYFEVFERMANALEHIESILDAEASLKRGRS
jgi:hypothetical protein